MLILASGSPRRQNLLSHFNIRFCVQQADIDESRRSGETAEQMTRRLALAKAQCVFALGGNKHWVLGGDTTVSIKNLILEKPRDRIDAMEMLGQLSGQKHIVISSVGLIGKNYDKVLTSATTVEFDTLTHQQIEAYCDSGEPFDKAGAYGIQGYAGAFVRKLSGSYSGVVGLPLYETRLLLEKAGLLGLDV